MTLEQADRKVIQCNYREGTNVASEGARAYVVHLNNGNNNDRIPVLVRSRGGRWVEKWEDAARLCDFRVKTLPPEHPLYDRDLLPAKWGQALLKEDPAMTAEQKLARLTTWLDTYPILPDDVSGDPELMVVQTVRRLIETDDPIEVVRRVVQHVEGCACRVLDGAVLNADLRCDIP